MQINKETPDKNSIQSYGDQQIIINQEAYRNNLIISANQIITEWPVTSLSSLDKTALEPILALKPELVLIGHTQPGALPPIQVIEYLYQQRIGIECMLIGPACRTFNVLLSEQRVVVLALIQ